LLTIGREAEDLLTLSYDTICNVPARRLPRLLGNGFKDHQQAPQITASLYGALHPHSQAA